MGIWDCRLGCSEKKREKKRKLHLVAVRKTEENKTALGCNDKKHRKKTCTWL